MQTVSDWAPTVFVAIMVMFVLATIYVVGANMWHGIVKEANRPEPKKEPYDDAQSDNRDGDQPTTNVRWCDVRSGETEAGSEPVSTEGRSPGS